MSVEDDIIWQQNKQRNSVTLFSYELGKLKEWTYVTKCKPWKNNNVKFLRRIFHGDGRIVLVFKVWFVA